MAIQPVWIGLKNDQNINCNNASCNGLLTWQTDAQDLFQYEPWMTLDVEAFSGSQCFAVHQNGKIESENCNNARKFFCQSDCPHIGIGITYFDD